MHTTPSVQAQLIVQALFTDMSDRRGIKQALADCDQEVKQEIFDKWCNIVDNVITPVVAPKLIYKIQAENGLFSTGGSTPQFTTKGKVWTGRGGVTNHLQILDR